MRKQTWGSGSRQSQCDPFVLKEKKNVKLILMKILYSVAHTFSRERTGLSNMVTIAAWKSYHLEAGTVWYCFVLFRFNSCCRPAVPLHRQSPWGTPQVQERVGQRHALRSGFRWHQPRQCCILQWVCRVQSILVGSTLQHFVTFSERILLYRSLEWSPSSYFVLKHAAWFILSESFPSFRNGAGKLSR